MIPEKDYTNAIKLINEYQIQLNSINNTNEYTVSEVIITIHTKTTIKTPTTKWKELNKCSARLYNILTQKFIENYIEDINKNTFLKQHNAGLRSWREFNELRNNNTT